MNVDVGKVLQAATAVLTLAGGFYAGHATTEAGAEDRAAAETIGIVRASNVTREAIRSELLPVRRDIATLNVALQLLAQKSHDHDRRLDSIELPAELTSLLPPLP